jgi:hypothetical protein
LRCPVVDGVVVDVGSIVVEVVVVVGSMMLAWKEEEAG